MIELSIIINTDRNSIKEIIEALKPLFLSFRFELIIINNEFEKNDIPYIYSTLEYSEDYSNFKNFCFASSRGKKVIIIEKGIKLSTEFINLIKNEIKKENYFNISYKLKTFLNRNRKLFFTKEDVFVYNRGIKGFNYKVDITVEDTSLLITAQEEIRDNIIKLIKEGYLKELFIWYKQYILSLDKEYQQEFYIQLEKNKLLMDENKVILLENLFLQSEIENNDYIKYLHYKVRLRSNDYEEVSEDIKSLKITKAPSYYCWLIKNYIIQKYIPSFISGFENGELLISGLLEEDNYANLYIYEFITDNNNSNKLIFEDIEKYKVFVLIITAYIKDIINKSLDFTEKDRLIKVFEIYIDLLEKGSNYNSIEDAIILNNWHNIKNFINDNKVDKAMKSIISISSDDEVIKRLFYHYLRRIRYESNSYTYVLSICMIVKNEEKNLNRCLSSLKPIIDMGLSELIVVDTGSNDNTVHIAKQYTDKVFHHLWNGNFSESRNSSLLYAEGKYIMIMDADEEFKKTEADKLISEFFSGDYNKYNAFTLRITSFTDLEHKRFSSITQKRIFKNDDYFYYENSIHNQAEFQEPVKNLNIEVLHYGYIMTEDIRDKKFLRTTTLLKKELQKDPRNQYYRYQLSSSYAMHNDLAQAIKQVDIMVRLINEHRKINNTTLMYFNNAIAIYLAGHKYKEAEKILDIALNISPDFIDFIYYKLTILFKNKQYKEAISYINKYLDLCNNYFEMDVANNEVYAFYTIANKNEALRLFILSNYILKNYDACLDKVYLIDDENILKNCLHEIIECYLYTNQSLSLEKFYWEKIYRSSNQDIKDVFIYFLIKHSNKFTKSDGEVFLSELMNKEMHIDALDLINKYETDFIDIESAFKIFQDILPYLNDSLKNLTDVTEILKTKKAVQAILHRTDELKNRGLMNEEELIDCFNKYVSLCVQLIDKQKVNLLGIKEILFVSKVVKAFNRHPDEYQNIILLLEDAITDYLEMDEIIWLLMNKYNTKKKSEDIRTTNCHYNLSKENIACNELEKYPSQSHLKVLHGAMDITDKTINLARALNMKTNDINAKVLNYLPDYSSDLTDYEMDINLLDDNIKLINTKKVANLLIERFDLFHFHYLTTLTLDHSDLLIIKECNKKAFMHLWGQDIRIYSKAHLTNPYLPDFSSNDDDIKRELESISKYISCCIICDYELYDYVSDYFKDIIQINRMIDINKYIYNGTNKKKKFSIVHVITSSDLQGSKYIIEAVEKIKNNYDIEFKLIFDMTNNKEMTIFKEADLIIDQILLGSYSQLAIEAMALGKPVVCWITDYMKEKYPKELPIIIANPDNIEKKLINIINNRDMVRQIGIKSREYVRKYHDINNEIDKLIDVYKM